MAIENTKDIMPLESLIKFWEDKLGEDDPLNPPNLFGEIIQDTIWHLRDLQGYIHWAKSVNEALNVGDGTYRP